MIRHRSLTAFALALLTSSLIASVASAQDATDIVRRTDALMAPQSFEARMTMDVDRDDGTHRTYELTLHRRDDNSLVLFLAPDIEKGRKMLRRGDDIWMSLPNVKRPVRVSARQSLMGGDFNNADVLRLSLVKDYTAHLDKLEGSTAVITLNARDRGVTYARVVARIDVATGIPVRYDYFTESGKYVKTLEFSALKVMSDGDSRPATWNMTNLVTHRKSVMRVVDMDRNKSLPDADYTLGRFSR